MPTNKHPFGALESLRAQLPVGEVATPAPKQAERKGPARAVVRFEKAGRRGKAVTVIDQLGLPEAELERWCSELKKELGCGGSVDGETIVLQGDLRARMEAALTRRGVRKVVGL